MSNVGRYPVERSKYFQSVGRLLEHRLGQIFQELGFQTLISKGQSNGLDLKVFDEEGLFLVAEVLNFSVHTELSNKRKNSIIANLLEYNCIRLLIYSCLKHENILDDLGIYGISTLKIGYQLQPKFFYDHFTLNNKTTLREVDSRETTLDIKSKLVNYLQSLNHNNYYVLTEEVMP